MKVGVLVPAAGEQEKLASGVWALQRQLGGSEIKCQLVAGGDEGKSIVLSGDEFIDIAVTRDPTGGGDAPVRRVAGLVVNRSQRQVTWQLLNCSVAVPVQISRRWVHRGDRWQRRFFKQRDSVPVNLKRHRQAKPLGATWQFVGQVHDDCLGFADRRSDGHVDVSPCAIGSLRLERGEGERQIGVVRGGDVGHAATEMQPTGHRQGERRVGGERAEVEFDRVRLGQASKLRQPQFDR